MSHLLSKDANPHVFLFAPYARVDSPDDSNFAAEFPVGLRMRYVECNRKIAAEVRKIFGQDVPFQVVPYSPRVCTQQAFEALTGSEFYKVKYEHKILEYLEDGE